MESSAHRVKRRRDELFRGLFAFGDGEDGRRRFAVEFSLCRKTLGENVDEVLLRNGSRFRFLGHFMKALGDLTTAFFFASPVDALVERGQELYNSDVGTEPPPKGS